jgi:glycerol uptake facilitator-like aquaporin
VLLLTFINVTGASINPARSFGPAVFVGGKALAPLWLFLLAPAIGGLLAGVFARLLWKVEPAADAPWAFPADARGARTRYTVP